MLSGQMIYFGGKMRSGWQKKINTEKDFYTKDTYLRIKVFCGIASYSLCKQTVKKQNAETLNKILPFLKFSLDDILEAPKTMGLSNLILMYFVLRFILIVIIF